MSESMPVIDINQKKYPYRPNPFPCGSVRQLLFDDFLFSGGSSYDQFPYRIHFGLGSVQKHGEPLFVADKAWEASIAWVSVVRDGGRYRMWYNSGHEGHQGLVVSYAESDDGLHFERRPLGVVEWRGSRHHNVVYTGGHLGVSPELGNVFIDPNAEEGERFKLVHAEWNGPFVFDLLRHKGVFTGKAGTLRGAYSPDGLSWTRYVEDFLPYYPDSQNSAAWDPTLKKYVVYHRSGAAKYGGLELPGLSVKPLGRGRAVGRIESDDFRNWTDSELTLVPDFEDTLDTDIYNSAYSRHPDNPNAHYLFPSFYRHYRGCFEVQVCVSRDNRTWLRPNRSTFIPLGSRGAFDSFIVSVAPGFVPISSDEWALYYRSGNGPHSPNAHILKDMTEEEKASFASRMSRAILKRDRVVGIEAGDAPGHFSTRTLSFEGSRLTVNVEPLGPGAELRVQMLNASDGKPIEGYSFDRCKPLAEDRVDGVVAWEGKEGIGPEVSRSAVRLHFHLRNVRLYAFQFRESPSG
ncbi:MAG: hypothetical protein HYU36_03865 [Planctomycetes bacterium]|nr:hypothetical protein [Planctomycetota bacterium]